ncbi:MAG: hypothetical protein K9H48_12265 [Melioribacteraceae bacterium]|nr:hypothetical protein [Melioribacteraceae bacterium]MCF8395083.1 hypothetical protein [Melioribacteraceae bacterium]MCF8420370.1 hypothetical protein [Melioribacteraceae bacterium]
MFFSNKKWRNYTAVLALFFSVMLIFEIIPRSFSLLSQTIELIESKAKIQRELQTTGMLNKTAAENKYLKRYINSIVADFQNDQKLSDVYALLNNACQTIGLDLIEIKSGSKKLNENGLWFTPFTIKLKSDYESIYMFFVHLQNSPKTFRFTKISVSSKDNLLELIMELEIYLKS